MSKDYFAIQDQQRARVYAAQRKALDTYWDDDGTYAYGNKKREGGYRAIIWESYAYLTGNAREVAKANAVLLRNYQNGPCAFQPGASIDLLLHHRNALTPEVAEKTQRYLELNVPYMVTEDLKIHGYNDNHPFKAMHALIVGGEMLGEPHLVERGLFRLRQAIEVFQRNGFPCEYNSGTYTMVSIHPLAGIVEDARNAEARELALKLEHLYWQDFAVHFDGRAGVMAGPCSRMYVNDYTAKLGNALFTASYLFPEKFDFDVVQETYDRIKTTLFVDETTHVNLPFYHAHPMWLASGKYHLTPEIERAFFDKPAGASVRGTTEWGAMTMDWQNDPQNKPAGAPSHYGRGPRRSALTTYFGERYSLGTARYTNGDGGQSQNFYVTVAKTPGKSGPNHAAVYYASMYFDERCPYNEHPFSCGSFRQDAQIRSLQHENAAMVFYNPYPYYGTFRRLRTGIFRPLTFTKPQAIFVGETELRHNNYIGHKLEPIAIDEGSVYVGFIPLRLTDLGNGRQCDLQVHDFSGHLVINISSFEGWTPRNFTYEQIVSTNAGFIAEVHDAGKFANFAAFRRWLAQGRVDDVYFGEMRTTTYEREGLKLSSAYGPYETMFRYTSINNHPVAEPPLEIKGMADPGYGLVLPPL
ncbi:MAG TPA: hypothetical protein VHY09_11580 [Candidatus Methylacidiphilales bacterium]|jgi:hypothetical protein|nr:hypothetical protein [Candidatus Methylacidiphilales bacterium]